MHMKFPLESFQAVSAASPWTYLIFGLIGFAFGYALEISGFGNSRKLAGQFYFKDLTVLKVMFTAIVVAMVLLFGAAGLGILDFGQVWVNPTYLGSGLVGGLIMGIGFIVGGFCPGTSVAATATGKIDGMFYLAGGFLGALLFGETEHYFDTWYNTAGYHGRLTLPDVFGLPAGVVVTLVVLMALFMFWGGERLERIVGKRDLSREPQLRLVGAAALIALALGVAYIGSPSTAEKYSWVVLTRSQYQETGEVKDGVKVRAAMIVEMSPDQALRARVFHVTPAEVFTVLHDQKIEPILLDVRPETDFNLFHLRGAQFVGPNQLALWVPNLLANIAPNRVIIVLSNDEAAATRAWKTLVAERVPNVYILDGGLNAWIAQFGGRELGIGSRLSSPEDDELGYIFPAALGDRYACSDPSPIDYEHLEFIPRIQLQLNRDKSGGGCG